VADSTVVLLSGVELEDLGPRRLRDLPNAIGLFQVRAPGLRTEFSCVANIGCEPWEPAATDDELHRARESELIEIEAAVRAHRLVTLRGWAGSVRPAWGLRSQCDSPANSQTVFGFSSWPPSPIPAAVPAAVAAVLASPSGQERAVSDSVAAAQEGRVRLFVFDNCEHVPMPRPTCRGILAQSATLKVLGHQSRRTRCCKRAGVASVVAGRRRWRRLVGK